MLGNHTHTAQSQSAKEAKDIVSANMAIESVSADSKHRKRGNYNSFDALTRAKIGAYASLHGNTAAARYFSKQLANPLMNQP